MELLLNLIDHDGYLVALTGLFCLLASWILGRVKNTRRAEPQLSSDETPASLAPSVSETRDQNPQKKEVVKKNIHSTVSAGMPSKARHRKSTYQLDKTRGGFIAKLRNVFSSSSVSSDVLEQAEEVLMGADIGTRTADHLLSVLKSKTTSSSSGSEAWGILKSECMTILSDVDEENQSITKQQQKRNDWSATKNSGPWVILVVGVNGVGKTTTIGKLASQFKSEGKRVLLAAGDTFRAAASEQLKIWADRSGAGFVDGKAGQDPTSVIVSALIRGMDEDYDVLIADTAGRLHNKNELMDELNKIYRSIDKKMSGSPNETLLVVDATTGQNAIEQAKVFNKAANLSSLVLTKLDGSAKGGIALGVTKEIGIPIQYVGVGEGVEDLKTFNASDFVEALFRE